MDSQRRFSTIYNQVRADLQSDRSEYKDLQSEQHSIIPKLIVQQQLSTIHPYQHNCGQNYTNNPPPLRQSPVSQGVLVFRTCKYIQPINYSCGGEIQFSCQCFCCHHSVFYFALQMLILTSVGLQIMSGRKTFKCTEKCNKKPLRLILKPR